ncbi:helix-turn-helix transcriptional regulator [Streptomyces platensis]|uniref:helix-turn-helix transcriptional regulator n=1 Tax=Streptomyces platensis TaxID=58346 RepID=UPI001302BE2C|nr:helix-turn-helix transcriptional regulator [Streptomyces platensis]
MRLRTLLRSSRLLTLVGPGGVGKTRLALELASRMRNGRPGRAQLVELASLRDGELLPQAVAVALGVGERGSRAGIDYGYPGAGPALTAREAAVARLVAEGLTNRQIATHLGLSPSTVGGHLDRVRDKSGLRTRTQIALWITGRNPRPAR